MRVIKLAIPRFAIDFYKAKFQSNLWPMKFNVLEPKQIEPGKQKSENLSDHGCYCGTFDTKTQSENKNRIENRVQNRSAEDWIHGIFRTAVRADHCIKCQSQHHKRCAKQSDGRVIQWVLQNSICCTEEDSSLRRNITHWSRQAQSADQTTE